MKLFNMLYQNNTVLSNTQILNINVVLVTMFFRKKIIVVLNFHQFQVQLCTTEDDDF